jgi:PGF-CTERM protein
MNLSDTQSTPETDDRSVSVLQIAVYVAVLTSVGAVLSVAVAGAGAQTGTDEPVADAVVVNLDSEGDGALTVGIPFDLTVAGEENDFQAFVESEAEQQAQLGRFESRLESVAAELESETGREMTVTDTSITTETREDGTLGLVVLTATWEGLAASNESHLVLGPPFDSGFDTDRSVVIRPPEQYQVVSTTPAPSTDAEQLVWNEGQSLDGFEVVVEPERDSSNEDGDDETGDGDPTTGDDDTSGDTASDDTSGDDASGDDTTGDASGNDGSGPGFGIVVALLGLAALGLGARKR